MKVLPARGVASYPLSPLQQGMLYHSLEASSPGVDVEQVLCELREPVDPQAFLEAWTQVAARHEILRTGFRLENGAEPQQVVYAPADAPLEFYYEELPDARALRRRLDAFLAADRQRGFPHLDEPPVRIALLRGGPEHFWFVITFHHLLLDGRALVVMFKEALDRHEALLAGQKLVLPAAPPYRQYIDWLQTVDWSRAETFWREYLQGLTAPTILPIARPAAAEMDGAGARGELACQLGIDATIKLRAAARRHQVTLNTLAQAAWAVVLGRYTGESDVVFGAVRACRHVPVDGAASIVGLFINTVPVRVRLPADAPLGSWLQGLREQWVALRDHEHTPLMRVQQWSEVAPGRALFETFFNYQEPSWDTALRMLGGKWEHRHFDIVSQPNYPLAIDAYGGAVITIKLLYDRGRFPDDAMSRLLGHYRVALEALAADGESTVGDLPLLTAGEQDQLLVEWNRTAMEYPRNVCIHASVEARANEAPDCVALSDAKTTLTFGELNRRANQLAHRLVAAGIGPETLVAVCMERSVEMIVAWLGVLKAGGAFCPLDPNYPADRLEFQLQDCGAPVVLTQLPLTARFRALNVTVMTLSADGAGFEAEPITGVAPAATAENVAYVIYTSGSTGRPKGVQIEHRALMNLVTWHQRTFAVTSADRATQVASPAFDASVWEIWPYLAAGASVHLPDEDTRISPVQLWRWLAEKRITIAFLPTPLVEAAMHEAWPARMALRAILTGGDKLKRRPPASFPCPLVNNYGPTENTVVATSGLVDGRASGELTPTIGRPIANTRVYVLDSRMQPVPIGVPGELFLTGESLARGYLNRPELTAEKFVPNPFGSKDQRPGTRDQRPETRDQRPETRDQRPETRDQRLETRDGSKTQNPKLKTQNSKLKTQNPEAETQNPKPKTENGVRSTPPLYRTGDLVRWTAHGELEFLGRLDGQVKIRGCRVELGEIEAVLQSHNAVRECVVVIRSDERHQPHLVAYVVAAAAGSGAATPESATQELELTNFLRSKLPAYMVPSTIMLLSAWPLTPNGKIDRTALPAPGSATAGSDDGYAAPITATEEAIARIWAEILGRSSIGRNDNFFDLGGHSLLAAQVVSRLNHALQAALSVRTVFDQPTIAGLARELETRRQAGNMPRIAAGRLKRRSTRTEAEILQPN